MEGLNSLLRCSGNSKHVRHLCQSRFMYAFSYAWPIIIHPPVFSAWLVKWMSKGHVFTIFFVSCSREWLHSEEVHLNCVMKTIWKVRTIRQLSYTANTQAHPLYFTVQGTLLSVESVRHFYLPLCALSLSRYHGSSSKEEDESCLLCLISLLCHWTMLCLAAPLLG